MQGFVLGIRVCCRAAKGVDGRNESSHERWVDRTIIDGIGLVDGVWGRRPQRVEGSALAFLNLALRQRLPARTDSINAASIHGDNLEKPAAEDDAVAFAGDAAE